MDLVNPNLIDARREEIRAEIKRLQSEDAELQLAQQVIDRLSRVALAAGPEQRRRRITQREFVLDALGASSTPWIGVKDIIRHAEERWGVALPKLSLRPLLTGMKREGVIVRNGRVMALATRAHEAPPKLGKGAARGRIKHQTFPQARSMRAEKSV